MAGPFLLNSSGRTAHCNPSLARSSKPSTDSRASRATTLGPARGLVQATEKSSPRSSSTSEILRDVTTAHTNGRRRRVGRSTRKQVLLEHCEEQFQIMPKHWLFALQNLLRLFHALRAGFFCSCLPGHGLRRKVRKTKQLKPKYNTHTVTIK